MKGRSLVVLSVGGCRNIPITLTTLGLVADPCFPQLPWLRGKSSEFRMLLVFSIP
jgi:hypothetical protein